jgi:ribosomal protein S18 acetylase RimI-like enzyme
MLSDANLLVLADASFAEFAREHARWLPEAHIEESQDVLLSAAGIDLPGPWNSVMGIGPRPADAQAALQVGQRFFGPRGRPYLICVRTHLDAELDAACQQAGFVQVSQPPGMVLRERTGLSPRDPGVVVRTVESAEDVQTFIDVMIDAYATLQLSAASVTALLSQPTRWLTPFSRVQLVLEHGRAVAGGILLLSHGVAGIYWVGTHSDARKRGHGETITRALSELAFDAGARAVFLHASPMGEATYRRIGYSQITRYRRYVVPAVTRAL